MSISTAAIFVVATTFTPGPNNVLSASMGALYGYRRTLPFLVGVTAGVVVVMGLCATVSTILVNYLPSVTPVLRVCGGLYMLWLAVGVYRASEKMLEEGERTEPLGFISGFGLQYVNPKGILYGLTVYSVFISPMFGDSVVAFLSAVVLALVAFLATSTWALAGHGIGRWVRTPRRARAVGALFAAALAYTAVDIAGVFGQ